MWEGAPASDRGRGRGLKAFEQLVCQVLEPTAPKLSEPSSPLDEPLVVVESWLPWMDPLHCLTHQVRVGQYPKFL